MGSCFGRCVSKESASHGSSGSGASTSSCLWRQATDELDAELISNVSERSAAQKENFIFRIIKFKRKKQKQPQFIDRFWERQDMNYVKIMNGNGNESIADIPLQNLDVNNLINSSNNAKESVMNYTTHNNNTSSRASSSLDLEWEHEYLRQFSAHSQTHQQHPHQQLPHYKHFAQQSSTLDDNHYDEHTTNLNLNVNVNLNEDSWHFLSQSNNDDDQLNSLASTAATATANERYERRSTRPQTKITKQNGGSGSFTRTISHNNSWSHISTPESLEWDIDEDQQRQLRVEDDNLGYETLELLHQIEQLKNQVLHETGDGLYESGGIEFSATATARGPEITDIS